MTEDKKDENIISSEEKEENVEKIDNQPEVDQNLSNQQNDLNYRSYLTQLVDQGAEQNYYEPGVVKTAKKYIKIGKFDKALEVLSPEDE